MVLEKRFTSPKVKALNVNATLSHVHISKIQFLFLTVAELAGVELPLEDEEVREKRENIKKRNRLVRFVRSILFSGREDDDDELNNKKTKPLPHWLIYIAYFLCFVVSAVSGFFVILYGFSFGKVKSDKWVVAMLVSFTQSVFLIQPVKV